MTRDTDTRLLAFCAAQYRNFNPAAWLTFDGVTRDELVATVLFLLAGCRWYGHYDALRLIANTLRPGCETHIIEQLNAVEFDCGRFDGLLRAEVSFE